MATADEWVRRYAERLGIDPPDPTAVEVLLAMTGVAAHASERTAAPISAWLAGLAGVSPAEAAEHARALAADLASEAAAGSEPG